MTSDSPRLLILGAHPDDAEIHAGGLAVRYRQLGRTVRMISVTNGAAGHHAMQPEALAARRRREAAESGALIGADYETWDFPDGALFPTLELRHRIIREIRTFQPDLVLTHRTCDYHPDHRAVGQAVQDASYLVTVPLVVPDVPILYRDPVVAAMADLFTRPNPLRPDVVLDVSPEVDTVVAMMARHVSQVFEFLPYNQGILSQVPDDDPGRMDWLRQWYGRRTRALADRLRPQLQQTYGDDAGSRIQFVEAYEISEYASALDEAHRQCLFPD